MRILVVPPSLMALSVTISGLEEDSSYTITVTASNEAGSAVSDPVTGITGETG